MPIQQQWDRLWLNVADSAATMSKDPNTKVGCVIVKDNKHVSIGYNGFAPGVMETPDRWTRPEKYEWVIHAEENAILQAPFDTTNATCYCTISPCHKCMARLIAARISRIVYRAEYINNPRKDITAVLRTHFDDVCLITT